MKKQLIAALGAAVLLGGTASAQTMPQPMSSPMAMPAGAAMMIPTSDAQFVAMTSRTNEDDIDLARAVLARTKNDAVKTFAQRTIDDDSSSQVSLRSAARTGSFPVPTYGKRGEMRMGRALLAENEPQLDADYMQMQLNRNRDTIAVLQWEIKNGTDTGLKAYASAQAPVAAVHAQMALAFGATDGKATRVNVGGQILGGGASGNGGVAGGNGGGGPYRPDGTASGNGSPATAPNGTAGNNPASTSGGSTNGTANGSGGILNTPGSKATTPPTSNPTPAPNTAPSPSPAPTST
jgi:predicted outer membrane protein